MHFCRDNILYSLQTRHSIRDSEVPIRICCIADTFLCFAHGSRACSRQVGSRSMVAICNPCKSDVIVLLVQW